jgi:hypothetical protein
MRGAPLNNSRWSVSYLGGAGSRTCPANDQKTKRRADLHGHCAALQAEVVRRVPGRIAGGPRRVAGNVAEREAAPAGARLRVRGTLRREAIPALFLRLFAVVGDIAVAVVVAGLAGRRATQVAACHRCCQHHERRHCYHRQSHGWAQGQCTCRPPTRENGPAGAERAHATCLRFDTFPPSLGVTNDTGPSACGDEYPCRMVLDLRPILEQ